MCILSNGFSAFVLYTELFFCLLSGFEKEVLKLLGDVIVGIKGIRKDNAKKAHRDHLTLPKDCVALPVNSVEELMSFDSYLGREENMDSVVCYHIS